MESGFFMTGTCCRVQELRVVHQWSCNCQPVHQDQRGLVGKEVENMYFLVGVLFGRTVLMTRGLK